MTWLRLLLVVLATFRLTRLVTEDAIWEGTRERLLTFPDPGFWRRKLATLIECAWCVSIYVGTAVTLAAYHVDGVWFDGPAIVLAASAVSGLLASWEGA